MATKKNTTSKTAPAKKPVAKSATAKKPASAAKKPIAKSATAKKPASAAKKLATKSAEKVATKSAAKKPAVKSPAKAEVKKPAKKNPLKRSVRAALKEEAKKAAAKEKKTAVKPVAEEKKATKKVTKKPTPVVEAPVNVAPVETPKATGMRTPIAEKPMIGKPAGALKPNYGLIRPKNDGKKAGSVRHVTRSPFKDEDLEEFKRRLLEEREKKAKLQQAMSNDALSRPDEENVEEDGTNSSNRADMLQRAEETRKSLRAIDDALRAIENKTYGICSVCKCAISRERLRAAPFAIRCVKCKEEWERQVKASKRAMQ